MAGHTGSTGERMMARGAALILTIVIVWLGGAASSAAEGQPQRIASFNLCADQLIVALADPGQIAGLSPYAADPALSVVAAKARDFPILDWQAETAVALKPDLVLVGPIDRTATRRMLAQLGFRVAEVALVTDIESARSQIRAAAALVGHAGRGEKLVAELDTALARLRAAARKPPATALVVERGGYASGPHSLVAALLAEAGLQPPPDAPAGFGGYLPLELLLTMRPDFLVLKDLPVRAADQGALFLTHPALSALYPPERRIALASRYSLCGGPALVAALNYLADVMRALPAK
jgi:iron complex transport system substrate-binding protein